MPNRDELRIDNTGIDIYEDGSFKVHLEQPTEQTIVRPSKPSGTRVFFIGGKMVVRPNLPTSKVTAYMSGDEWVYTDVKFGTESVMHKFLKR